MFNFTPDQDIRIDMALLNLGRLRALRYERNRFNAATRPVDGQYPGMQWCLQWWYPCFQAKFRIHKQITTRLHETKHVFFVRLIVFHFGGAALVFQTNLKWSSTCREPALVSSKHKALFGDMFFLWSGSSAIAVVLAPGFGSFQRCGGSGWS